MAAIKNPLIIDIEASGFGEKSHPVEVGAASSDQRKHCTPVKPGPDRAWWVPRTE